MNKIIRPYRIKNRVGEINQNKQGSKMQIIEYIDCNNIKIQFENGYVTYDNYANFKKGLIKNPYDKTIYGIGYIGIDDYYTNKNVSYQKSYQTWRDILYRCYNGNQHNLTYKDCFVCDEWHNYSNFKKWYDENYYNIPNEKLHIDKDILIPNNKEYCPSRCLIVPQTISQVFEKHNRITNNLPQGISHYGKTKYMATVSDNLTKKRIYSDVFNSVDEAKEEYIKLKNMYIIKLAEHYKPYIPFLLYDILIQYSRGDKNSESYIRNE